MLDLEKNKEMSDEELVSLSLENADWYKQIVLRYEGKLFRYIMRIFFATKEDAEDILQEVFLKTYKNLNDFDRGMKFSSWIYRICHNEAVSHLRKKTARPKTVSFEDSLSLVKNISSQENIMLDLERKDIIIEINEILAEMDEKYREILVLKFLEEKNYQEISDILEKPMGTVATLISRAKKQFREKSAKRDGQVSELISHENY